MAHRDYDFFSKESTLIHKSQRALADGREKDPIVKLRLLCLSRGLTGILQLARVFRKMDHDGDKILNLDEFTSGLRELGLQCSDEEAKAIFNKFDSNENGGIVVSEFLNQLRPPVNKSRLEAINKAYEKMDPTGRGYITFSDLKRAYSVKVHPKYASGDMTENEVWKEFISNFKNPFGEKKKTISKEEFVNFYTGMSAAIENNAYFILLMRQSYRL